MSQNNPVTLLSDDDDDEEPNPSSYKTSITQRINKRPRSNFPIANPISHDFEVITLDDDDSTPLKLRKSSSSSSPPSVVPETPLSQLPKPNGLPLFRCTAVSPSPLSFPVDDVPICVESEDECEKTLLKGTCPENVGNCAGFDVGKDLEVVCSEKENQLEDGGSADFDPERWLDIDSTCYLHKTVQLNVRKKDVDMKKINLCMVNNGAEQDSKSGPSSSVKKNCQEDDRMSAAVDVECLEESLVVDRSTYDLINIVTPVNHDNDDVGLVGGTIPMKCCAKVKAKKKDTEDQAANKKKSKEEKMHLMEEKKLRKEQEKLRKEALKAEAAKAKEIEKAKQKWEKHKFNDKDIVAEIDTKAIQLGKIGGYLLTRFGEKDLKYTITSNPIEKSIVWRLSVPEGLSQLSSVKTEVPYILLIYEAEEFCKLINEGCLLEQISSVQAHYPAYKICCLTNCLMSYINKREQAKYKKQTESDWMRPPVEEVFAKLTTQFANVRSRQCADEAEVAEHVVLLTSNLAKCHSRKKLSHLSVNANGANAPKDCVDGPRIKKDTWLKALVSIPKVQPRFAIAISKTYPTMKSLLKAYLDPTKSVHEKEFLLKDLPVEGVLGNDDRRLGEMCSKRVYRILMAQNGDIKTDDVETGADYFT